MLTNILTALSTLRRDEKGATAIEYGLIAAFVALAIVAGATTLGDGLSTFFTNIGTTLSGKTM